MTNLSNVNFNLVKILEISIINIKRINLIWDKILSLVKLFASELTQENDYTDSILKFTVELLISIIIHILLKFNYNKEEKIVLVRYNLIIKMEKICHQELIIQIKIT
jgi:hypothetical protein